MANHKEKLDALASVVSHTDNEATSYPWWAIVTNGLRGWLCVHAGPWFSREAATEYLNAKAYNFPKSAYVFCFSGHESADYRRLVDAARPEPAEPERWAASDNDEEFWVVEPEQSVAIAEAIDYHNMEIGQTVYFGRAATPTFGITTYTAESILDRLLENVEWAEIVADKFRPKREHLDDLAKRLNETLNQWAKDHDLFGGSFSVEGVESREVTADDF